MKQKIIILLLYTLLALGFDLTPTLQPEKVKVLDIQTKAYAILQNKCNVCHRSKNPQKVFTYENMNGFAKKINRQVFIWKRMPKGNEIKLSELDRADLKNWIKTQIK